VPKPGIVDERVNVAAELLAVRRLLGRAEGASTAYRTTPTYC
jgi:hypothetical protein